MPRTQSISSIAGVSFPPSQDSGDAPPKTPIRSRLGISGLPTPFSGRKSSKGSSITKSQDASLPGTPIKSAFLTSGSAPSRKSTSSAEDAYPSPSKDKDPKHHKASTILRAPSLTRSNSSKDKENHSSSVAARAKARIASVLSKPSITTSSAALQAQHERSDLHLSVAGEDLVDTLRAIRARSASTISVDSVATVRASLSLERPASQKRERTDSMVSVRTMRDEPIAPSRKRERVESTASVDSFPSVREVKPITSSNGKRQRLHSNTSGSAEKGGASAAALAAHAAVAASRAQELHKKSESEDEDEEEVLRMLSPLNTHNADVKKSTHSPLDLLRNSTKPSPLLRKESTCALITPALASARLDLKPRHQQNVDEDKMPEIPSEPSSPVNHARSFSDEVDASFFTMDDRPARCSGGRRNPAGEGYSLSVSLSDTAFWDITPTSTTPLTVHGTLILADPHPSYAYPPDVALDISCSVAPVQRGLGRLNRPVEMETPVDVFVDREWERVREGWSAPVELRIPPSLFGGAESRVISLLLEGNLLLPRGRGDVEIEAQAQISVSALRSNREMALSEAEKVRIEAIQKERGERERRYEEMCVEERERLMGMKYEEMTEEEREKFREWMDAQEDVL